MSRDGGALGTGSGPIFRPARPGSDDRPRALDIQIHPANRRRRVRTLSFGRLSLTLLSILVLGHVLFVACALALAPGVARGLAGGQEYPEMAALRMRQGAHLQELVRQLDALSHRGEKDALDLRRIELAYGLPEPRPAAVRSGPGVGPDVGSAVGPGAGVTAGAAGSPVAASERDSIYVDALRQGERLRARQEERLRRIEGSLAAIQLFETAHPERIRETPATSPLRGRDVVLVASFSRRRNPFTHELAFHLGLDLAAPAGSPVRAPADGRVAFAGHFSPAQARGWWRLGNVVILAHGDRFATVLGHDSELLVHAGQTVRQGEVVAKVGATGWTSSPQLHYEVWRRAESGAVVPVDPRLYILDRRWPNEELLAAGGATPRAGEYDPLPVPLAAR